MDTNLDLQNRRMWAQLNDELYHELQEKAMHHTTITTHINHAIVRHDGIIVYVGSIFSPQFAEIVNGLTLPDMEVPF